MDLNHQWYEPVNTGTDTQKLPTSGISDGDEHIHDIQHSPRVIKPWYNRMRVSWNQYWGQKTWRYGLFAGLYASSVVLATNIAFLLYGTFTHDGVKDGIATIMQGDMKAVSYTSTSLHILINVLSTTLLTSSNYAMQVLCAPTRSEINIAHSKGRWLEIGIMSFRNIRHIDKKRGILWWSLAFSSAPLHLLYVWKALGDTICQ
jgi:hypothetical protein